MSDNTPVKDKADMELPVKATDADNAEASQPAQDGELQPVQDYAEQAVAPSGASDGAQDNDADSALYPYPPEAYEVSTADGYVSDVDKAEEESSEVAPAAEAGGGDGNGTDDGAEADEDEEDAPGAPLTLTDHFRELRNRLIKIFLGVIIGFLVCWSFSDILAELLYLPLVRVLPVSGDAPSSIIFTGIAEGFFTHMKLAIVAGIFLTSPFIFYQIWSFIAPGLYDEEKKFVVPVAVCSAICFIAGGCFCYFVVFPNAFRFFMTYSDGAFKAMPSMKEYFNFTMQLILAFGMVFELPLFTFFLARIGLVTAPAMRRFRRYFIVIAFVLAAMLTPPDVISQLLMAAPMLILYELSIFIAAIFGKKAKKDEEDEKEDGDDSEQGDEKAKA